MEKIKPALIILSDLWGARKTLPLGTYTSLLKDSYHIRYYDSTVLAEIPSTVTTQNELHQAFVNGGLEIAVANLAKQEHKIQYLSGLSIGGVIAWRYALQHPSVKAITAISATRLRYENQKPNCAIQLFYGQLDSYQPSDEWYHQMQLSADIIKMEDHDLYRNEKWIRHSLGFT